MKTAIVIGLSMLAASAALAGEAPTGFAAIAARGEVIEVRAPMWRDGTVRVGTATGRVTRRALGRTEAIQSFGPAIADIERSGRMRFSLAGGDVGGELAGDCVYARSEVQMSSGPLTLARPTAPLRLRCSFARDGAAIGTLDLDATAPARRAAAGTERRGEIRVGTAALALRSAHRLGAGGVATDTPVGYEILAGDEIVGMVDTDGLTRRRLALPRDPAQRDAALAAGVALSLFWDPGDTDD